ncbi:MAG: MoaD/ThiS family protein [Nitrososphaerales archaeon]
MIRVKLLGGAKKIVGKDDVSIEKGNAKLKDIVEILRIMSSNNTIFNSSNMLIVVNGVESSMLGGIEAQVKDGDVVSIIPVVHGGWHEVDVI